MLGVEVGLKVGDELVHLVPGVGVDDARLDEADLDTEWAQLNAQAVGHSLERVFRGVIDPGERAGPGDMPRARPLIMASPSAKRSRSVLPPGRPRSTRPST